MESRLKLSDRLLASGLAVLAALVAVALFLGLGLAHNDAMDAMARRSLPLEQAISNGKPTLVEFYAGWCEACRSMAPAMEQLAAEQTEAIDVVLLNIENPRWQPELERRGIQGIPTLALYDAAGAELGQAVGVRSAEQLHQLAEHLTTGTPLTTEADLTTGRVSRLDAGGKADQAVPQAGSAIAPRSHS